jgi:hypothetical protein
MFFVVTRGLLTISRDGYCLSIAERGNLFGPGFLRFQLHSPLSPPRLCAVWLRSSFVQFLFYLALCILVPQIPLLTIPLLRSHSASVCRPDLAAHH